MFLWLFSSNEKNIRLFVQKAKNISVLDIFQNKMKIGKLGRKKRRRIIIRSIGKEEIRIRILVHLPDDWPRQLSYPGRRQNYFFLSSNVSNGCRPQFHLEPRSFLSQIASSASLYFPRVFIFQGIPRLMISSSFPVSSVLYYLFSFSHHLSVFPFPFPFLFLSRFCSTSIDHSNNSWVLIIIRNFPHRY